MGASFSFSMIWSLYPATLGQAIPPAIGRYLLAATLLQLLQIPVGIKKDDSCAIQESSLECCLTLFFSSVLDKGGQFINLIGATAFFFIQMRFSVKDRQSNEI